jgi:hypothetical protein
MGEKRTVYRLLVESQRKRPLGKPRRSWIYNIKMDVVVIGLDGMDWIDLAQDR